MNLFKQLLYMALISLFLGFKVQATSCTEKKETVGLLELRQMNENGQCILIIHQNDPILISQNKGSLKSTADTSKRRYTFTQSGFLELFDPDIAQEFQFTKSNSELKYTVQNNQITVQLPSGQKMTFGESRGGEKGNIKSFQGFKSASEDGSGLQLVPQQSDALLASSPLAGGFPHEKSKSPFSLITSAGKISTLTSQQIFSKSQTTYPTFLPQSLPPFATLKSESLKPSDKILTNKIKETDDPPNSVTKTQPTAVKTAVKSSNDCKNYDELIVGLNSQFLKIQGELSLSKLAYFYLKDSGQHPSENLKLKINRLLQESDLKDKQELISRKIAVNSNLIRIKSRLLNDQKKWSASDTDSLLLNETDFQYFSLLSTAEKKTDQKSVINLINMIDSSYRNSENSIVEKFRALDKRFKILSDSLKKNLDQIQQLNQRCTLEAKSSCSACDKSSSEDSLSILKTTAEQAQVNTDIQWGAFWLHTGKKGH